MADESSAPKSNTIAGQVNQYLGPIADAIRVPQQGEPGYQAPGADIASRYPAADQPLTTDQYPDTMDANTQAQLLGAANPPDFQNPQNPLSNVPPEQNVYASDLEQKQQQPKTEADPFSFLNQQISAQQDLNNASQTLEKSKQAQLLKTEEMQNARIAEFQKTRAIYDTELNNRMSAIDAQLKDVEKNALDAQKSTSQLFQEKSNGQKIAAGVAMILGVAHSGITGSSGNIGVQVIQNALQNEKNQFMQKYANSKDVLNLKRQNMDDYTQAMAKHETLADKQMLMQLQAIQTKFQQAESIYRGSASAAQAKNAIALIEQQKQAMKSNLAQREALNQMMESGVLPNPLQAAGLPKDIRDAIGQTRELSIPGYQGVANSKEDRDQFQRFRQSQEPAINGLQRILELQKNSSRLSPEQRAKISSEVNAATGALREAIVGPGAMTQQEYERLIATIGNPNKLFSLPSWERAKTLTALNKLKSDLNSVAKARGFKPPQEFQGNFKGVDPKEVEARYSKFLNK